MRHHILYLMGGSGCGKTTLAYKLEEANPEKYHRVLEITTRPMRENETNMVDYEFMTNEDFDRILEENKLFESVRYQFYPYKYGARYDQLSKDDEKWDIVVASIEGFLSSVKTLGDTADHYLINIITDDKLDIQRDGRDPKGEEHINLAVLENLNKGMWTNYRNHIL